MTVCQARLRHVDSGEWRYGAPDDDRPTAAGEALADARAGHDPAPDLWLEDPSNAWGVIPSWPEPTSGSGTQPEKFDPDAWFGPPVASPPAPAAPMLPGPAPTPYASAPYSPAPYSPAPYGSTPYPPTPYPPDPYSPATGYSPTNGPTSPATGPTYPAPTSSSALMTSGVVPVTAVPPSNTITPWSVARHSAAPHSSGEPGAALTSAAHSGLDRDGARRWRRGEISDEPISGPVLRFTAGWYGVPAVFYLVWLITLASDRRALVGRGFLLSLPWLFAAVALSVGVASLLRRFVVGWRALTLSFAAAIIGAGLTTIAHSIVI